MIMCALEKSVFVLEQTQRGAVCNEHTVLPCAIGLANPDFGNFAPPLPDMPRPWLIKSTSLYH